MNIEDLQQRICCFELTDFSGPVTPSSIDDASRIIGLPFGREYRQFLEHLGSGSVESEEFIGLGGQPHLNVIEVRENLLRKSKPLAKYLIPLRGDGFGNYDCVNTALPTENNEFSVVQWLHDGDPNHEYQFIASSYFEWFNGVLDMLQEGAK